MQLQKAAANKLEYMQHTLLENKMTNSILDLLLDLNFVIV